MIVKKIYETIKQKKFHLIFHRHMSEVAKDKILLVIINFMFIFKMLNFWVKYLF